MRRGRVAAIVGVFALSPLAGAAETPSARKTASPPGRRPAVTTRPVGPPAKPFTATSIKQKQLVFPRDYKGKMVLITFWATWCPYCREEVSTLRMAYARYHRKGLEIIGISADASRQRSQAQLAQFVQKNGMLWEQVYTGVDAIESQYKVTGFPTSFLVDGTSGRITALRQALRGPQLLKTLERLMGPPGTPAASRPAKPPVKVTK